MARLRVSGSETSVEEWRPCRRLLIRLRANHDRHSVFIGLDGLFSELNGLFTSRDLLFFSLDTFFVPLNTLFSRRN